MVANLVLGGSIQGTVIDDQGKPIANAAVTTDLNGGIAADSEIFRIFRDMMPEKHTKATGKTDAQGRFRINKLAYAEYMVRVSHPDYCEGSVINLKLENEGQIVDAGVIQLSLGATIEGVTMVGGQPTGQVKVSLSSPGPSSARAIGIVRSACPAANETRVSTAVKSPSSAVPGAVVSRTAPAPSGPVVLRRTTTWADPPSVPVRVWAARRVAAGSRVVSWSSGGWMTTPSAFGRPP